MQLTASGRSLGPLTRECVGVGMSPAPALPRRACLPPAHRSGALEAWTSDRRTLSAQSRFQRHRSHAGGLMELAVGGSTLYAGALCLAMMATGRGRRASPPAFVRSWLPIAPLALVYAALLAASWQPDTLPILLPGSLADGLRGGFRPQFFPSVNGVSRLFAREMTAASLWVHILAVNVASARWMWLQYFAGRLSRLACVVCVGISAVFAPVGLLLALALLPSDAMAAEEGGELG